MWQSLHDAWWRLATQSQPRSFPDALASGTLAVGAVAYQAAVALRNTAYDRGWVRQVRLPCHVISVGNLTVGGTGKTTCVELIVEKLQARGHRVAVLSRGYAGSRRDYWLRSDHGRLTVNGEEQEAPDPSTRAPAVAGGPSLGMSPETHRGVVLSERSESKDGGSGAPGLPGGLHGLADEPQLLARHLDGVPIFVGARREHTGRLACERAGADTLVLDDGFQHRRVARDCDIVLVNARMPLGGWACLPRGPMREPILSLRRAHVIMITKADEALNMLGAVKERLRSLNPEAALVATAHEPATLVDGFTGEAHDPKRLEGRRVGLLSSIGDPQGFEATIQRLHATISWHRAYPDHYPYQAADWTALAQRQAGERPDAIVTTEKDWVRLQSVVGDRPLDVPLWVLGIRLTILHGEDALDARLAARHTR